MWRVVSFQARAALEEGFVATLQKFVKGDLPSPKLANVADKARIEMLCNLD